MSLHPPHILLRARQQADAVLPLTAEAILELEMEALRLMDSQLQQVGLSLAVDFPSLPQPPRIERPTPGAAERRRWEQEEQGQRAAADEARCNPSQRIVVDAVTAALNEKRDADAAAAAAAAAGGGEAGGGAGTRVRQQPQARSPPRGQSRVFFIDAPGGYGKTFVTNLLLASVRARGGIALAVASSGIAALLMDGGTTAHSRFKIPVGDAALTAECFCSIRAQSENAQLIREADLILWDEAPMTDQKAFGAVERTLRDLTGCNLPFGGKVFVMAGDFRQVLPVVPRGNRASIVAACVKRHELWRHVRVLRLTTNMRVQRLLETLGPALASAQQVFANFLLAIGEGLGADPRHPLLIPEEMVVPGEHTEDLISEVFGDLANDAACRTADWLMGRCILSPKNNDVLAINDVITGLMPGQVGCCGVGGAQPLGVGKDGGGSFERRGGLQAFLMGGPGRFFFFQSAAPSAMPIPPPPPPPAFSQARVYLSADWMDEDGGGGGGGNRRQPNATAAAQPGAAAATGAVGGGMRPDLYPVEFLNTLNPQGLPTHKVRPWCRDTRSGVLMGVRSEALRDDVRRAS